MTATRLLSRGTCWKKESRRRRYTAHVGKDWAINEDCARAEGQGICNPSRMASVTACARLVAPSLS